MVNRCFPLTGIQSGNFLPITKFETMKIKKVITIGHMDDGLRGAQLTRHMNGNERISFLEELRQETAKVFHYEYPRRLRRVFKVIERNKR